MNTCSKCGGKLIVLNTRHVDGVTIRAKRCVGCRNKYWTIEEEIFREDYLELHNKWRLQNEV